MVMIFQRALLQPGLDVTEVSSWRPDRLPSLRLFDLPLLNATPAQTIEGMLGMGPCRAAFVNAHCVNVAHSDPEYRRALASADLLLPDGAGIELAARWHGARLTANLNGTDLCPVLANEFARRDLSLFLLGGLPGVAEKAARALVRDVPRLRIAGVLDGFAGAQPDTAIPTINASGAHVLWVGMGVPTQDVWLARHNAALSPRLVMGVGALFDFLSGRVLRAPLWMRRSRAEWLWRLGVEPRRMFGRYVIGNALFLSRAWQASRQASQRGAL
jgi:exopolysaccharide biosynthesis WecB/TagA/CpsF family protein